ncbi:2-amino-3,7-dideoxy-D-threo-hept-6-ulosonate synthase [Streptomyces sp. LP05-1]|uniref:2-amino-3,7-dideoxy-D-threo-hept-6-ulosonate synthase n=1 Tax=Streptomyces pyxinae TaxID=2970734 RepID=A0ABT2CK68_9ACTN|nr:2-amino-3,7-dideoxy-D-threo-hept-6-ulosonate synthase [Streptomyces sp. LP05-1]MCS0637809.1 2-amino-3,7-dideoxy-D-threo-hept-6-ulosonate synthase [Streptomyces sp. LP05-1]
MPLTGKALRLERLSRAGDGRYLFIPLDHSVSDGPIVSAAGFPGLVADIGAGGADAVVVHKGRARLIPPELLRGTRLVVHLSASTAAAPDVDAKVLVGDVEECVRLGADAVSVHVNIGSDTEAAQLGDLGTVAAECERWGMPLLAMVYPRGPRVADPTRPELVAHAVTIAADLGVDIVKTVLATPAERMAEVVASSPLPVIVAGGAGVGAATKDGDAGDTTGVEAFARAALAAGCAGLAVGRRVFTHPEPRQAVRKLAAIVHGPGRVPGSSSASSASSPDASSSSSSPELAGAL